MPQKQQTNLNKEITDILEILEKKNEARREQWRQTAYRKVKKTEFDLILTLFFFFFQNFCFNFFLISLGLQCNQKISKEN